MQNLLSTLFSFQGRTTRTIWWISVFVWGVVETVGTRLDYSMSGKEGRSVIFRVVFLASVWPMLAIQAKRWHDRNKSGWWLLINILPLVGVIWTLIENGCLKGTSGSNQYGQDPLEGKA